MLGFFRVRKRMLTLYGIRFVIYLLFGFRYPLPFRGISLVLISIDWMAVCDMQVEVLSFFFIPLWRTIFPSNYLVLLFFLNIISFVAN